MSDLSQPCHVLSRGAMLHVSALFRHYEGRLDKVCLLAGKVRDAIQAVDAFIQHHSAIACPRCEDVCCENRHAYYNYEDLVYIHGLGLTPHDCEQRDDAAPCQFLSPQGCRLERALRPSRCNWYFCDALYDSMEKAPGEAYARYDESLRSVAELWMEMIEEFRKVTGDAPELWSG